MPRWLHVIRSRLPRRTAIWAALCLLLALGFLTTIADMMSVPKGEIRQANETGQRSIIDPVSGTVSTMAVEAVEAFEVSNDDPAATPAEAAAPTVGAEPVAEAPSSVDGPALRTEAESAALPKIEMSTESIVAPPAPEITELGKRMLPKRGENNSAPSTLYARRFQRQEDTAYITFLITDVGFNAATLSQIVKLPREVTLAISPYALDPKPQIELLHNAGFETWGMLPVQSIRYPQDDPGPLGLISGQSPAEQTKRLHEIMSATLGAVGLVLPPEEAVTVKKDFASALADIDKRGLLVLSTHPTRTVEEISPQAEQQKIIRRADVLLDSTASAAIIQSKLAGLKALAQQQKKLVVVLAARPQTLNILSAWLKKNPLGEVKLAPLSAIYGPDAPPPPPEAAKKPSGGHGGGKTAPKKESSGGGHH